MNDKRNNGYVALTILLAVLLVGAVSVLPLNKWSNGLLRDFDLLADILPVAEDSLVKSETSDLSDIDPLLLEAITNAADSVRTAESSELHNDTLVDETDSVVLVQRQPSVDGEKTIIEDYTGNSCGLENLRTAINNGSARIAVVGDSYIEGDIMTQDLRRLLQDKYGGKGVGYVGLHSDFPGFRRSVKQSGNGWHEHSMAKKPYAKRYGLMSERYYTSSGHSSATFKKGTIANALTWDKSSLMLIAPHGGTVKLTNDIETRDFVLESSGLPQMITLDGSTEQFKVELSDSSIISLGVWLTGENGISLDCISSRGHSGLSLAALNSDIATNSRKYVDYDLIILEFGVNAMSAGQRNYSVYSKKMSEVIDHISSLYPDADILVLSIGDRGEKKGGVIKSMSVAPNMVEAQREAARRSRVFFWDMRQAMGGDGTAALWAQDGLINKDYIHLNHKGGARLANLLFEALVSAIDYNKYENITTTQFNPFVK